MGTWTTDDLDRMGSVVGAAAHDVTIRLVPAGEGTP